MVKQNSNWFLEATKMEDYAKDQGCKWVCSNNLEPGMVWKALDKEYTISEVKRLDFPRLEHGFLMEVIFDSPDVEGTGANWRHFKANKNVLIKDI